MHHSTKACLLYSTCLSVRLRCLLPFFQRLRGRLKAEASALGQEVMPPALAAPCDSLVNRWFQSGYVVGSPLLRCRAAWLTLAQPMSWLCLRACNPVCLQPIRHRFAAKPILTSARARLSVLAGPKSGPYRPPFLSPPGGAALHNAPWSASWLCLRSRGLKSSFLTAGLSLQPVSAVEVGPARNLPPRPG